MTLERIVADLSRPEAYPFPVDRVEVRHTHISVVFLAGDRAVKIKKAVRFSFLDYSTLKLRRHYCEEEVRLNRRWAPSVYEGVVGIVERDGRLRLGGPGKVVEHAVLMRRLPDEASLRERVRASRCDRNLAESLGRRVAEVHARSERSPVISSFARFPGVARNARGNLRESKALVGRVLSRKVYDRISARLEAELRRLKGLINARADRGLPCDTHGDLRLEHVYHFPGRPPPDDLLVLDGIEFNERFRFADPVADMAFLAMDFALQGRPDLTRAFAQAYFEASGDEEGRTLLPFYMSYRAAVRGKVQGLKSLSRGIPPRDREDARRRSRPFWLRALADLEPPVRKPCLVLMSGLPGTGKTALAKHLARRAGFVLIRTDVVRKRMVGRGADRDLYTAEGTRKAYEECLSRARRSLLQGRRVLVDAGFRTESTRGLFAQAARDLALPLILFHCSAPRGTVRSRLAGRQGDASDADWAVYRKLARQWEKFGPSLRDAVAEIDASGTVEDSAGQAVGALRRAGLLGD